MSATIVRKELLAQVRLAYSFGGHGDDWAVRTYTDGELGLVRTVHTAREGPDSPWGEGKVSYELDGKEYKTSEQLQQAIADRPDLLAKLEARYQASKKEGAE